MKNNNFSIRYFVQFLQNTHTETRARFTPPDLTKEFCDLNFTVKQVYQTLRNLDPGKDQDF